MRVPHRKRILTDKQYFMRFFIPDVVFCKCCIIKIYDQDEIFEPSLHFFPDMI